LGGERNLGWFPSKHPRLGGGVLRLVGGTETHRRKRAPAAGHRATKGAHGSAGGRGQAETGGRGPFGMKNFAGRLSRRPRH